MSIEKYITKTVDFDSVIDNFSAIKVKKVLNIKYKILEIWKMYRMQTFNPQVILKYEL